MINGLERFLNVFDLYTFLSLFKRYDFFTGESNGLMFKHFWMDLFLTNSQILNSQDVN